MELALLQAADVARELDHHGLHAQADAEVRDLVLARVADGVEHAFDAALAEAARHQDAVESLELPLRSSRPVHAFGLDPVDVDLERRAPGRHAAALPSGSCRNPRTRRTCRPEPIETSSAGCCMRSTMSLQRLRSRGAASSSQQAQDDFVHAFAGEHQRHFVDDFDIARGDDGSAYRRRRTGRSFPSCPAGGNARSGTAECRAEYRWRAVP